MRLHKAVENRVDAGKLKSVSFGGQLGGALPLAGLVRRYMETLARAQKRMHKTEKEMKKHGTG